MKKLLVLFFVFLTPGYGFSKTIHRERVYQEFWCNARGGQMEVVLSDQTRVDCLTDKYAIEADFGQEWAEAIGQALFYGAMTGKKPGILLIIEKPRDKRHLKKLLLTIKKYNLPVKVWIVKPEDL